MFSWNIAKSAEAMVSRWAIKRVCQFLLKKKLGQLLLGDIDLNQLDVQLRAGTIQLSDVALNVDYVNQKLGGVAALTVKEGSIGSLSVTMPWKGKGCQIEIDELELVLGPGGRNISQVRSEASFPKKNVQDDIGDDMKKPDPEIVNNNVVTASLDVHEGVKTIAKMVKWLLTSFHVKVKKLIVAFDLYLGEENNKGFCRTLVLRINEIECGTGTSGDNLSDNNATDDNFLGLKRLTNFVKFHGAILEFLKMDDERDNHLAPPCSSGTSFDEYIKESCLSSTTTSIVTGGKGGFSGTVKLSIPWKNGSLDIRKVDADVSIDPLEIRFQPSSIKCFLHLWDIYRDVSESGTDQMQFKEKESIYPSVTSKSFSSIHSSHAQTTEKMLPDHGISSHDICSSIVKETVREALLPGSHVISDWVPSITRNQRDSSDTEPDFGASVDQFFECFDELRTSQSALGNSGIWNWTCSVFSAITAASNLASGSLHIPTEHKHVETNLKAAIAGISVLFTFVDEDHPSDLSDAHSSVHYLGANLRGTLFILQACPQEMNIKATVEHFELSDCFSSGNDGTNIDLHGCHGIESQAAIAKMQAAVESAFPLSSPAKHYNLAKPTEYVEADAPIDMHALKRHMDTSPYGSTCKNDVVKVTLLRTSGVTQCHLKITFGASSCNVSGASSFSLKLPPFVFWMNFHLVSLALDNLKEIIDSVEMMSASNTSFSEACYVKYRSSSREKVGKISCPQVTTSSSEEGMRGNIFLPNARIILCFPFEKSSNFRSYTCWDQFIALDISSPLPLGEDKVPTNSQIPAIRAKKSYFSGTSCSLHLNVGNLGIHLISPASECNVESNSCMQNKKYRAQTIVSVTDQTCSLSVLSMFWQDNNLTDPGIAEKAKLLATLEDSSRREKSAGKGHEFASVTTIRDMKELDTRTREEIILSSSFILHAHLPPVKVILDSSQYESLNYLLGQVTDWLSFLTSKSVDGKGESSAPQTSLFLECDILEFQVRLEATESIKSSIHNELPGCWHSFKLQIRKFELLSSSNVGGISDSNLFWLSHGAGNLWGSVTSVPSEVFLLVSCSNSARGRGDGDGSNVLSSRFSGSDFVHFWDPENSFSLTSITIRCGTLTAVGGRLDWINTIISFFSLPSPETEQTEDINLQKGNSKKKDHGGSSFVVNLVDIGLSYKPYLGVCAGSDGKCGSINTNEEKNENYFGCLLAASSLKLSNTMFPDSVEQEYKIRVQELGLLLCQVSGLKNVNGPHSVEDLRNHGYVKVAQEAHVEALLRMNCVNGHLWEVECTESHIILETCHDTTDGLIRLSAQLQQLFAPDMEESLVHLQNRWNNMQQAHLGDEVMIYSDGSSVSISQVNTSTKDTKNSPGVSNWMEGICEDAFQLNAYGDVNSKYKGPSKPCTSLNVGCLGEISKLDAVDFEKFASDVSSSRSMLPVEPESNSPSSPLKSRANFIEEYFLSDLRPLSEVSLNKQPSDEVLKCRPNNLKGQELQRGKSGWYGDISLRILENHVSEVSKQTSLQQSEEGEDSNHKKHDDREKVMGNVILKNINVMWRLYAGSDWKKFQKNDQHNVKCSGRDTTVSLELSLSGMEFRYYVFPDGEINLSKLSLSILDFHLNDNSTDSPWKLVLGYYHSKDHPRESFSKALKLDLETVRPDPLIPLEEYRLCIALLPIRLHLHQRQLDFLVAFFGGRDSLMEHLPNSTEDSVEPRRPLKEIINFGGRDINDEALLPYFQKFDILPVTIRVDYSPCHVDLAALRGGKYVELVNLVPWKGVELKLKHVQAMGIYGWSSVGETIIGEWLEDISQNQVHKLLKGLPPIRSVVSVSSGAAKLVSLPVKNYKKDHRLFKGMQRGTIAFLRSISVEAIGLGVHLAAGAHEILLQAEYILTSVPPSVPWPDSNVRANQPKDARQGIQQAYESISDGFGSAASTLVHTPFKRYQHGAGVGPALATAVQAAPAAAIAPASAAARAVHCAFLGVRNSLDLEHKKESMDKYLGAAQPM